MTKKSLLFLMTISLFVLNSCSNNSENVENVSNVKSEECCSSDNAKKSCSSELAKESSKCCSADKVEVVEKSSKCCSADKEENNINKECESSTDNSEIAKNSEKL